MKRQVKIVLRPHGESIGAVSCREKNETRRDGRRDHEGR